MNISRQTKTERYILKTRPTLYLPLWKLDGASFLSKDGYGHVCTVTGATWTPQGRSFGSNQYISAGNSVIFQLTTELTLEMWVKPTTSGYLGGMPGNTAWANPWNAYQITYDLVNTRFTFQTNNNGAMLGAVGTCPASVWYHIFDIHKQTANKWESWVNGVLYKTTSDGDPTYTGNPNFSIMTRNIDAAAEGGQGIIGEIRVYSRALSVVERQHNYLATKWRYQ